jgi:hypothetical protein
MPPIHPLDYIALITDNSTQLELSRTIEDLSSTLALVEHGLADMLDSFSHSTIEEEQEDGFFEMQNSLDDGYRPFLVASSG